MCLVLSSTTDSGSQNVELHVNSHVGPAVVPGLRFPVFWAQADGQLEGCGEHHVCHHTQQTWQPEKKEIREPDITALHRSHREGAVLHCDRLNTDYNETLNEISGKK